MYLLIAYRICDTSIWVDVEPEGDWMTRGNYKRRLQKPWSVLLSFINSSQTRLVCVLSWNIEPNYDGRHSSSLQNLTYKWKTHTWGWGAENNKILLPVGPMDTIFLQALWRLCRAVCWGHWRVTDPHLSEVCEGTPPIIFFTAKPMLAILWRPNK